MISKTLTIFVLGLLLAMVAHGEPRLVDHEDAAPEAARLLKGSKGGKSSKGSSRLLKASKSKSGKSGKRARYLKGSKSGKSCKGSGGKGSGCGKGARE